jgi:hypothetical protein
MNLNTMVCFAFVRQGQQTPFVSHPYRPEWCTSRETLECVIFIWSSHFEKCSQGVCCECWVSFFGFFFSADFMEYFLLQLMKLVWMSVARFIKLGTDMSWWLSSQVQTHLPVVDSQKFQRTNLVYNHDSKNWNVKQPEFFQENCWFFFIKILKHI